MTRTHRTNSNGQAVNGGGHVGPSHGQVDSLPRSFGKHEDIREGKSKKDGAGKGNWGREGDEAQDLQDYVTVHPRRRSNSNGGNGDVFLEKTKFETTEPVFEEDLGDT